MASQTCRSTSFASVSQERTKRVEAPSGRIPPASPARFSYFCGKFGLEGATRIAAFDLAARGITVNGIAPGLVLPSEPEGRRHVWHQYTVRVAEGASIDRDGLAESLAEQGVGSGIYYPRVAFDYDCYRAHEGVIESPVPNAERAAAGVLSLPVHPFLSESDLETVATAVRSSFS